MTKIAVYGTLREGFGNNRLMQGSKLIGTGLTVHSHSMYASGIPYVVENGGQSRIKVEVYEVSDRDLPSIDSLEGHPRWYQRRETPVELENGEVVDAWLYFMDIPEERRKELNLIESGDYADYRNSYSY